MKDEIKFENGKAILCCGSKKCPMLVKNKDGMIEIEDDFGGKIIVREDQARLINKALDKIEEEK
jgi:hypothetical protein